MWTKTYWKRLAERVTTAFAGGTAGALIGSAVSLWDMDLTHAVGVGLGSALVTLLLGLGATRSGDPETPDYTR